MPNLNEMRSQELRWITCVVGVYSLITVIAGDSFQRSLDNVQPIDPRRIPTSTPTVAATRTPYATVTRTPFPEGVLIPKEMMPTFTPTPGNHQEGIVIPNSTPEVFSREMLIDSIS